MSFFQRQHYQSEITQFLQQLKIADPTLESRQREGHNRLRNVQIYRDEAAAMAEGTVPQASYPYFEHNIAPARPILPNFWKRPYNE